MADPKIPNGTKKIFTVDADQSGYVDMPSVTKLLNRKSLSHSNTYKDQPPQSNSPSPPPFQTPKKEFPLAVSEEKNPIEFQLSDPGPQFSSPDQEAQSGISLSIDTLHLSQKTAHSSSLNEASASSAPLEIEIALDSSMVIEGRAAPMTGNSDVKTLTPSATEKTQSTSSSLKIQRAKPREDRKPLQRLALWETRKLKAGADPLGKGLAIMLERGAFSSLFLAITPPPAGSPVPHFTATAAVAAQAQLQIWTGLKWDPTIAPELWNQFVRSGMAELAPPGTSTDIKSNRNIVRAAFGMRSHEWLTLVRAGTAQSCRGVLALISEKSLMTELSSALPLIQALPAVQNQAS